MPRRSQYNSTALSVTNLEQVQFQCDDRGNLLVNSALKTIVVGSTVTRPADTTAYASGDLVANSTTAGSVTPISFANVSRGSAKPIQIRRVRLLTSSTSVTNASFRLHLYKGSGTIVCANGDNAAWSTDSAASYLGFVDITVDKAFTDGAFGVSAATEINCAPTATTLYGLLEARGAYTPTSAGTFIPSLEIDQN